MSETQPAAIDCTERVQGGTSKESDSQPVTLHSTEEESTAGHLQNPTPECTEKTSRAGYLQNPTASLSL